jgi:hypothetical protein
MAQPEFEDCRALYFLFGWRPGVSLPEVYVRKSDDIKGRLMNEHRGDDDKYFSRVPVFLFKDGGLKGACALPGA